MRHVYVMNGSSFLFRGMVVETTVNGFCIVENKDGVRWAAKSEELLDAETISIGSTVQVFKTGSKYLVTAMEGEDYVCKSLNTNSEYIRFVYKREEVRNEQIR